MRFARSRKTVIPAQAGIHGTWPTVMLGYSDGPWIPAFAGMTVLRTVVDSTLSSAPGLERHSRKVRYAFCPQPQSRHSRAGGNPWHVADSNARLLRWAMDSGLRRNDGFEDCGGFDAEFCTRAGETLAKGAVCVLPAAAEPSFPRRRESMARGRQ